MKEENLQMMMDMPAMHRLMHDHRYDWDSSMNDIGMRGGAINPENTKMTQMEEMQQFRQNPTLFV